MIDRTDVAVAVGAGLVAAAALLSLPALADLDPDAAGQVPGLATRAWWVCLAVVVLQAGALVWRRRRPHTVLMIASAAVPLAAVTGAGGATGATSVAVLVAAYTVAASAPLRRGAATLGAAAGLVAVGTLLAQPTDGTPWPVTLGAALVQGFGTVGLATLAGVVVGSRREAAEAHALRESALSREHEALVQAAVARERTAMARELHDIAAHHLSGIAVMAGAIGRQIDTDPEAAKVAVQRVRGETTAMLTELRSLVRLLRESPSADDADAHVETLATVPSLVERVRASGVDATLTVLGTPDGRLPVDVVGPLAQLAAYRTVQECLANVVRHAPGARCEVVLDARDPTTLLVSVRNGTPQGTTPPAVPGSGLGLVGMQERADLTDAHLSYGRQPDGGWLVTLALPVAEAAGPGPSEGTNA